MSKAVQVRFGGFGGQGIVLAGLLLGRAASFDSKFVAGSNSYGAQARGSACRSEVIISEDPIDFPHVTIPDILVVMSQRAYELFSRQLARGGLIFYDSQFISPRRRRGVVEVSATGMALQDIGDKRVANVILLAAVVATTGIVSQEALLRAIDESVKDRHLEFNKKAAALGFGYKGVLP
ncbi:MAG: 2-oxoacid:acceptor oxidoreductase family protein [Syntrophobacterales bacterium]|nr:MAG: 2-oxoacid:acceptor oxidoreductase family protein [Syntrophobacterales bacterium]